MDSVKYTGMDVHQETISIAVRNSSGKLVMECIIETKASTILQFSQGLSGSLQVTYKQVISADGDSAEEAIDSDAGGQSFPDSAGFSNDLHFGEVRKHRRPGRLTKRPIC
jgi:hypothetical protein